MATQTRVPESNVDTSDWTTGPSGGGVVWQMLDETIAAADDNTTYVQNNSGFNTMLICQSDDQIGASDTVTSVKVRVRAIIGANTPQMSVRLRVNGTNYELIGAVSLTGSYAVYEDTWTDNPDIVGTAAWLAADVNGSGSNPIQGFGCRAEDGARVTAMEMVVTYTPSGGGGTSVAVYTANLRRQGIL